MLYSHPRTTAEFDNWPSGGSRVLCRFYIENDKKGRERVCRQTQKNGQWGKPKKTTYGARCAIVDGEDGRTYVLIRSENYPMISVVQSNLQFQQETFHYENEDYNLACNLIKNRADF
jgi:hypothetical protein